MDHPGLLLFPSSLIHDMRIPLRLTLLWCQEACQSSQIHMQVETSRHRRGWSLSCAPFLEGRKPCVSWRPLLMFLWPHGLINLFLSQSVVQKEWNQSVWLRITNIFPGVREGPGFLRRAWLQERWAKPVFSQQENSCCWSCYSPHLKDRNEA